MGKVVSLEAKQQVLKMLQQGMRSCTISKSLGLAYSRVREWQYLFDGGDKSWVSDKPIVRVNQFSEEMKDIIVEAFLNKTLTMADLSRTFLLPVTVIKQWVNRYKNIGAFLSDEGKRNTRTETKIEDFRTKKQVLGNLFKCLSGVRNKSSKKKILRAIEQGRSAGLTLKYMFKELRLSSSTYYKWVHESKCKDDPELIAKIREIQERENYNIGYVRMSHLLEREGFAYKVNPKKTLRIMREQHLQAKQRLRKHPQHYYRKMKENATVTSNNILNRDFSSPEPGKKFVTDITFLPVKGGWCYLAVIKDLFNNEIVAHSCSRTLSFSLVKSVVVKLKDRFHDLNGVILHSDRGWTYTKKKYITFLKELGIIQSFSHKGDCWDNASMENFFGLFKTETIYHFPRNTKALTYAQMIKLVEKYINYYNHNRISKKLNWMSPVEFRIQFNKQKRFHYLGSSS